MQLHDRLIVLAFWDTPRRFFGVLGTLTALAYATARTIDAAIARRAENER